MSHQQIPFVLLRNTPFMDQNSAIGAIGAVLGYIGAEGANPTSFERLLWPQRAHAGFTWRHAIKLALLGPGGGPVHKAALKVLDKVYEYGLLRGSGLGHMLGSVFFPEINGTYSLQSTESSFEMHTEPARNCLWSRVVMLLPTLSTIQTGRPDLENPSFAKIPSRAQVSVHQISLSVCDIQTTISPALDVGTEDQRFSLRILAGIFTSEITGIILTILVAAVWRSWLAVLWIIPLLIKLAAAATALGREHLILPGGSKADHSPEESTQKFEVKLPLESGTFLILTGPPSLIYQFFRHYGHPLRSRYREVIQLALVVLSACIFPVGLILSVTIMSDAIQYLWISHQMYLVLTMYTSRYMSLELWASTEELIAGKLVRSPEETYLWSDKQTKRVVKAAIQTTFHGRYGEAREHAKKLLEIDDYPSTPKSETNLSDESATTATLIDSN